MCYKCTSAMKSHLRSNIPFKALKFLRCHSFTNNLIERKYCCGATGGHADKNNKTLKFQEYLLSKHLFPDNDSADRLQKLFPNPKKIVDDVFAPFLQVEDELLPTVHQQTRFYGQIHKTELNFSWPIKTGVYGVHTDKDISLQNAYLRACEILMHVGFIKVTESDVKITGVDNIISLLEEINSKLALNNPEIKKYIDYEVKTDQRELVEWSSSIQVFWPIKLSVSATAPCLDLASYKSCLRLLMKLKAYGYLDVYNELNDKAILLLNKDLSKGYLPLYRDLNNADFEVYVDASGAGMGAYLLRKDNPKIHWLSERWRTDRIKFVPSRNSALCEFTALVTAIYTWKHKFSGKKVLCYSDNLMAVCIVNHGSVSPKLLLNDTSFSKLLTLLTDVCNQRDITLVANHVPREYNMPADLLSRGEVDAFKKLVPMAFETPKKSKKLWFLKIF